MKVYMMIISLVTLSLLSCKEKGKVSQNDQKKVETHKKIDSIISNTKVNSEIILDTNLISIADKDSTKHKIVTRFGDDNERRFPAKIQFISGKVLDVRKVDPYAHVFEKELKVWDGGLERLYDLNKISQEEKDRMLKGIRLNKDAHCTNNYLRLMTKTPRVEISGGKTIIAYHAAFYCAEDEILGTQGYALIYDKYGNLLRRVKDRKDGFYDIRLSSDGKYLMQKYGYDYGEGGEGQLERGFRFYDTDTGEMIFEWELGKDKSLNGFDYFPNKYLSSYYRTEKDRFEYYIIDIEKGQIYYKNMTRRKYFNNPEYRKSLFPNFVKTKNTTDLLLDGFKKIN